MFGLFKAKKIEIFSPLDGNLVDLEDVEDEVFSKKLVGDGIAIIPLGATVVSPIKGTISRIFKTKHAFSIKSGDIDILVHIGLDTVDLDGKGFELLVKEGDRVDIGTPIVTVDIEYLLSQDKDIITPIIVSSSKNISIKRLKDDDIVKKGEAILEVKFI
jgi:PTS system glucose-specific IIA component